LNDWTEVNSAETSSVDANERFRHCLIGKAARIRRELVKLKEGKHKMSLLKINKFLKVTMHGSPHLKRTETITMNLKL